MKNFFDNFITINKARLVNLALATTILSAAPNSFAMWISFNDPLVDAADKGDIDKVSKLIKSGYKVDSMGDFEVTPLMRAAFNGQVEIVKLLIGMGAYVNYTDIGGESALHLAAKNGHVQIVKILLESGADIDIPDKERWTPLMRAILAKQKDVVALLISKGASSAKLNENKETPLLHATMIGMPDILNLVLDSKTTKDLSEESIDSAQLWAKKKGDKASSDKIIQKFVEYKKNSSDVDLAELPTSNITSVKEPTNNNKNISEKESHEQKNKTPLSEALTENKIDTKNNINDENKINPIWRQEIDDSKKEVAKSFATSSSASKDKNLTDNDIEGNFKKDEKPSKFTKDSTETQLDELLGKENSGLLSSKANDERKNNDFTPKADLPPKAELIVDKKDDLIAKKQISVTNPRDISEAEQFYIQLGTYRDYDQALYVWNNIKKEKNTILADLNPIIRETSLYDKSYVVYRLRSGPFVNKAEAEKTCSILNDMNKPCYIVESAEEIGAVNQIAKQIIKNEGKPLTDIKSGLTQIDEAKKIDEAKIEKQLEQKDTKTIEQDKKANANELSSNKDNQMLLPKMSRNLTPSEKNLLEEKGAKSLKLDNVNKGNDVKQPSQEITNPSVKLNVTNKIDNVVGKSNKTKQDVKSNNEVNFQGPLPIMDDKLNKVQNKSEVNDSSLSNNLVDNEVPPLIFDDSIKLQDSTKKIVEKKSNPQNKFVDEGEFTEEVLVQGQEFPVVSAKQTSKNDRSYRKEDYDFFDGKAKDYKSLRGKYSTPKSSEKNSSPEISYSADGLSEQKKYPPLLKFNKESGVQENLQYGSGQYGKEEQKKQDSQLSQDIGNKIDKPTIQTNPQVTIFNSQDSYDQKLTKDAMKRDLGSVDSAKSRFNGKRIDSQIYDQYDYKKLDKNAATKEILSKNKNDDNSKSQDSWWQKFTKTGKQDNNSQPKILKNQDEKNGNNDGNNDMDRQKQYDEFKKELQQDVGNIKTKRVSEAVLVVNPSDNQNPSSFNMSKGAGRYSEEVLVLNSDNNKSSYSSSMGAQNTLAISRFDNQLQAADYWDRMFKFNEIFSSLKGSVYKEEDNGIINFVIKISNPEAVGVDKICNIVTPSGLECNYANKNNNVIAAPNSPFYNNKPTNIVDQKESVFSASNNLAKTIAKQVKPSGGSVKSDIDEVSKNMEAFWVNFGTFADGNEAENYWMYLQEDNSDILHGLKYELSPVDSESDFGDKAVKLFMGPFVDNARAGQLCNIIKYRKIACLIVKK